MNVTSWMRQKTYSRHQWQGISGKASELNPSPTPFVMSSALSFHSVYMCVKYLISYFLFIIRLIDPQSSLYYCSLSWHLVGNKKKSSSVHFFLSVIIFRYGKNSGVLEKEATKCYYIVLHDNTQNITKLSIQWLVCQDGVSLVSNLAYQDTRRALLIPFENVNVIRLLLPLCGSLLQSWIRK